MSIEAVLSSVHEMAENDARGALIEDMIAAHPLPITVWRDDRLVLVNPAFCGLIGRVPEQVAGHEWSEFIAPEFVAETVAIASRIMGMGEGVSGFRNEWLRPDGGRVGLTWYGTPPVGSGYALAIALPDALPTNTEGMATGGA